MLLGTHQFPFSELQLARHKCLHADLELGRRLDLVLQGIEVEEAFALRLVGVVGANSCLGDDSRLRDNCFLIEHGACLNLTAGA